MVGEAMLDRYLRGGADRLCREAPVPVVTLRGEEDQPGGAANTAANLSALGAHVRFVSAVGDDDDGRRLERAFVSVGVEPADVVVARHRVTQTKTRVFADDQLIARLDAGSTSPLDAADEDDLIGRLEDAHTDVRPRGRLRLRVRHPLGPRHRRLAAAAGASTAAARRRRQAARAVSRDERDGREAELRRGDPPARAARATSTDRVEQVQPHDARLLQLTGARIVAATLDERARSCSSATHRRTARTPRQPPTRAPRAPATPTRPPSRSRSPSAPTPPPPPSARPPPPASWSARAGPRSAPPTSSSASCPRTTRSWRAASPSSR